LVWLVGWLACLLVWLVVGCFLFIVCLCAGWLLGWLVGWLFGWCACLIVGWWLAYVWLLDCLLAGGWCMDGCME
jgi:hypothetical protein